MTCLFKIRFLKTTFLFITDNLKIETTYPLCQLIKNFTQAFKFEITITKFDINNYVNNY